MEQSSKMREQVEEPRIPSLSSFLPNSRPFIGFGTISAEMPTIVFNCFTIGIHLLNKFARPLCFNVLSVVARTTEASLSKPFVIQAFVPFSM